MLQDATDSVLRGEPVPPEASNDTLQPLRRGHDSVIAHEPPQQAPRQLLSVRPRHECPERRCIQVHDTPAKPAGTHEPQAITLMRSEAVSSSHAEACPLQPCFASSSCRCGARLQLPALTACMIGGTLRGVITCIGAAGLQPAGRPGSRRGCCPPHSMVPGSPQ